MGLLESIITACGGAAVTGIFALIAAHKANKREREKTDNAILKKLEELEKKLDTHITEDAESKADESRARILRFGDEVRQGILHTAEHWADILRDVDRYEDYCIGHPSYENNRAVTTIEFLKDIYSKHLMKNDFLK